MEHPQKVAEKKPGEKKEKTPLEKYKDLLKERGMNRESYNVTFNFLDTTIEPITLCCCDNDKINAVSGFLKIANPERTDYYIKFEVKNLRKGYVRVKTAAELEEEKDEYKIDLTQEPKDDIADEIKIDESVKDDREFNMSDLGRTTLIIYGSDEYTNKKERVSYPINFDKVELIPLRKLVTHVFIKNVSEDFKKKIDVFHGRLKSYRIPTCQTFYHSQAEKVPTKGPNEHLIIVTDDNFMEVVLKEEETNADRFFIFSKSEAALAHKKLKGTKVKEATDVIEKLFAARNWDFQYVI